MSRLSCASEANSPESTSPAPLSVSIRYVFGFFAKNIGYPCILFSLDQVLGYEKLLNIPQADERNRETVRKEVPLFSNSAYEETVINAFIHNRWLDGNAPMFTAHQNRIEILSRGNLPPKQTIQWYQIHEFVKKIPLLVFLRSGSICY